MCYHWEVVQSFLDEKPDDTIGVEDKIGSLGVFVADDALIKTLVSAE